MITNFEKITEELTEKELELVDVLVMKLGHYSEKSPIKSGDLLKLLPQIKGGVKLRKLVNYIRTNSLVPLIATKDGYFISYSQKEIEKQIRSLHERANSINDCAQGLIRLLARIQQREQPGEFIFDSHPGSSIVTEEVFKEVQDKILRECIEDIYIKLTSPAFWNYHKEFITASGTIFRHHINYSLKGSTSIHGAKWDNLNGEFWPKRVAELIKECQENRQEVEQQKHPWSLVRECGLPNICKTYDVILVNGEETRVRYEPIDSANDEWWLENVTHYKDITE